MVETRVRITKNVNQIEARVSRQVHDTLHSGPAGARHLLGAVGVLKLFNRAGFRYGLLAGAAGAILAIRYRRKRAIHRP